MAKEDKGKNAPTPTPESGNAPAPATEGSAPAPATEKRAKAPAGSSIPTQAKQLIVILYGEISENIAKFENLKLTDLVAPDTAEWFAKLSSEIAETSQRGLPLAAQLQAVQKQIAEHYSTPGLVVDGKFSPSKEWETRNAELVNKREKIETAIQKEAEEKKGKNGEGSETESAPAAEDSKK